MFCEVCGKKVATVHYTEIVGNQMTEMHLCEDCAKDKGAAIPHFSISDLLAGLADFKPPLALEEGMGKCSRCGLTYSDFKKEGRLGCGNCYRTFKGFLAPLLKRIHGNTTHVGRAPSKMGRKVEGKVKLQTLNSRLQEAIRREEFEEAARLRDEIRKLEKKG